MMKAYPEYRDSGLEWLGEIPSHWEKIALKHMATEEESLFIDGDWIESKDLSESGIRYITTGNVGLGKYKEQGTGYITEQKFSELNCTEVFANDLLISRLNSPIGRACLVPELNSRIVTSVDNVIMRPNSRFSKRYLVYLFSSNEYINNNENLARGATMQRISRGLLGNVRVIVPETFEEQEKIADYLDVEVGRVDNLITEKENFIKLLSEKRQALISHVVTKGLNPNVPMKDSGVEWIGEIPEHWDVAPIKYFASMQGGFAFSSDDFIDSGVQLLKIANVYQNRLALERQPTFLSENYLSTHKEYVVKGGDILISLTGTLGKRDYGYAVLVKSSEQYMLNQRVGKINSNGKGVNQNFLLYSLWSDSYLNQLYLLPSGTKQANLSNDDVLNIKIAFPPSEEEQNELINQLEFQLEKVEQLLIETNNSIELLKEHRTALISAAVTGKIDVREEV